MLAVRPDTIVADVSALNFDSDVDDDGIDLEVMSCLHVYTVID